MRLNHLLLEPLPSRRGDANFYSHFHSEMRGSYLFSSKWQYFDLVCVKA